MKLTVAEVERICAELNADQSPPPQRQVSKLEAIRLLAPEIARAQKKGYRVADIATLLTDGGLQISRATLANYLRRARRGRRVRAGMARSEVERNPPGPPQDGPSQSSAAASPAQTRWSKLRRFLLLWTIRPGAR